MFVRWQGVAKQRDPLTFDFKRVDFSDISFPLDVALLYKARIILIYSLPFSSRVAVIFPSQPAALTNPTRNFSLQQAVVMNVSCAFLSMGWDLCVILRHNFDSYDFNS